MSEEEYELYFDGDLRRDDFLEAEGNRCYQCQYYNSTLDLCHLRNLFGYCDFKSNGECKKSEDK